MGKNLYNSALLSKTSDFTIKPLFYVKELKRKQVSVMLEFKQAGCLYTILHLPIPACCFYKVQIETLCGWLNFMHVIPNVAAEAFTNQTIRSQFLTCQILSLYKWTVSSEFILNVPGAKAYSPYEICCSCKSVPQYGNKSRNRPQNKS